eukprot:scaffold3946_cov118-Isochrysis_galbana.AAC.1
MLLTGVLCLKHGRRGKPHPRHVRCDPALQRLEWAASALAPADKFIEVEEITAIEAEPASDMARKAAKGGKAADGHFLSIATPRRSLDLEFRSVELRDAWMGTLTSWRELVITGDLAEPTTRPLAATRTPGIPPRAVTGAAAWARRTVGRSSSLRSSAVSMASSAFDSAADDSAAYDSGAHVGGSDTDASPRPCRRAAEAGVQVPYQGYGGEVGDGPSSAGHRALGRVAAAGRTHWGQTRTPDRTTASRPRARPPPACSRAPRRSAARSPPFPPSQWTYPSTEEGGASSSHGECARPQLCVARARLFDSRRTVDAMRTAPVQYYCISSPRLLHARHLSGGVVWWAPAVAPLCPDAGC